MNYILGPESYTPEWYALRVYNSKRKKNPVVFGASEAAAVCGLGKYQTPLHVYLLKRGEIPPVEETDAMRLGKLLEPIVLGEYQRRTNFICDTAEQMLLHAKHPHIGCTLDAWVCERGPARNKTRWVVDAKTTSFRRAEEFGEEFTDEIPDDYNMQLQQQMLVSGCEKAHLAVMLDGRTLKIYEVEANETLQEMVIECTTDLMERIVAGDQPEPTYHHEKTGELLKSLYGVDANSEVLLSEEAAAAWYGRESIKSQLKELKDQEDELWNILMHRIGNAATGILPNGEKLAHKLIPVKASVRDVKAYTYHKITKPKVKD